MSAIISTHRSRPILFSGPMVRAILDGRKTQTRRVTKPQPPAEARDVGVIHSTGPSNGLWSWLDSVEFEDAACVGQDFRCPYGVPGDLLWIRETWGVVDDKYHRIAYRADEGTAGGRTPDQLEGKRWRPSIHLPRFHSRLTLLITDVRIERLQEIREADAVAEGVEDFLGKATPWKGRLAPASIHAYAALWESINGAGSWAANPWVWCIEFERVADAKAVA